MSLNKKDRIYITGHKGLVGSAKGMPRIQEIHIVIGCTIRHLIYQEFRK
jgi:hypothetical protein